MNKTHFLIALALAWLIGAGVLFLGKVKASDMFSGSRGVLGRLVLGVLVYASFMVIRLLKRS